MIRRHIGDDDDDIKPIGTMVQMLRPMYIILALFGIASIVFVAEIIIFTWKQRRRGRE